MESRKFRSWMYPDFKAAMKDSEEIGRKRRLLMSMVDNTESVVLLEKVIALIKEARP